MKIMPPARFRSCAPVDASLAREARPPAAASVWRRWWLGLLVHCDAFRLDPFGYVQGVVWRLRGLRVRSRNRLAALMGRSPHAYALWVARAEPKLRQDLDPASTSGPPIRAVIDCSAGSDGLEDTLDSLRKADPDVTAIAVGAEVTEIPFVARAGELASLVTTDGSWLCIIRAGDRLAANALAAYRAAAARHDESWLIYADDDLIDGGKRVHPHFKCAWNPELFENHDFISGAAIVRATPPMLTQLPSDDWVEALVHAALKRADPVHLPAVLHHRRGRPAPSIPPKPPLLPAASAPLVSVIIPTRNGEALLRTCVEGLRRTAYPEIELLIVDNGSDEPATLRLLDDLRDEGARVCKVPGPFNFSTLNNAAARHARGDLLCFLNNDIEILDPDWLSILVLQAIRPEIGAVGCRLLYPDGSVQHAGVVTGVGGGAAHAHRFQRTDEAGYFLRDRLPQRVSAVTAACLVVAKDKFLAVGGFNEEDFAVAFNDVDLCLKLNSRGWQSFYEPRATLVHHESKSRGSDRAKENRARFAAELSALKRRWGTDCSRDPYHHPQLSPFSEQFYVAL